MCHFHPSCTALEINRSLFSSCKLDFTRLCDSMLFNWFPWHGTAMQFITSHNLEFSRLLPSGLVSFLPLQDKLSTQIHFSVGVFLYHFGYQGVFLFINFAFLYKQESSIDVRSKTFLVWKKIFLKNISVVCTGKSNLLKTKPNPAFFANTSGSSAQMAVFGFAATGRHISWVAARCQKAVQQHVHHLWHGHESQHWSKVLIFLSKFRTELQLLVSIATGIEQKSRDWLLILNYEELQPLFVSAINAAGSLRTSYQGYLSSPQRHQSFLPDTPG